MLQSRLRPFLPISLLLLAAWGLLVIRLGAPWFGHHDWNGTWFHAVVRNYELYGAWDLRLMQVDNRGPATPETYHIYDHRPPLTSWLMALIAIPVGLNEASIRFVMVAATTISVAAFYVLNRRLYDPKRAWWSSALYALTPMMAYFGRNPEQHLPSLALIMTYAAIFVNWLRRPTRKRWLALAGLALLSPWTDWTAILYVGALGAIALWLGQASQRRAMLAIGGLTLLSLVALIALDVFQWPGALESLKSIVLLRTSNQSLGTTAAGTFTFGRWLSLEFYRLLMLATPGLLIMALAGIPPIARHASRLSKAILAAFFSLGAGYPLVFRNAAYFHDYFLIFLIPPMAMAASSALVYGRANPRIRRFARPALTGLLLVSLGIGAANLLFLHQSGERANSMPLAQAIAEHTTTQDLVMSNLPHITPALELYAFRNVAWSNPPDTALARAEAAVGPSVYVYCRGINNRTITNSYYSVNQTIVLSEPPAAPPAEMEGFPYEVEGGCLYIRLR